MSVVWVALFIAFLWGVAPVIHKHVLKSVDPKVVMITGSIFYTACLIVFWFYHREFLHTHMQTLTWTQVFWIASTAVICGFFTNIIYYHILQKHDSYVVSALIYSSPVFTFLLAYLFLKEKITLLGSMGVMAIVAGVVLLSLNERHHHQGAVPAPSPPFIKLDNVRKNL